MATKKSTQKKVAPAACDPSLCEGQPVSWRLRGVPRNSLRAESAPFEQTRQASSRSAGTLRRQRHPTNTTTQAHAKGGCKQQPNTSRPSLRSACLGGRAQRWPASAQSPSECAEEHRVWAGQLHRRVQLFRELTHRVCLNGAPLARSEFRGTPRKRHDTGCPSQSEGSQAAGAAFFWVLFLAAQEKYLARRGETRPAALRQ